MTDLIKQDINFMENPLWMQNERQVVTKDENGYVWQDKEGYFYRAGYKLPVKTDFVFLLYILLQSQQNGWKDELSLTRYEILNGCGIKRGKFWYERLKDSLNRWQAVTVNFQGTFYDNKEYKTLNFSIIDYWGIEKKSNKLQVGLSPKWLLRIKNSDYFKYIDFDQIKALRSPLVIRLYEILVKNFQRRTIWEIDSIKLATKIPMNEKHPSHIIPKIKAAVNRINEHSELKIDLTVKRPERGKAKFIFEKVSKKKAEHLLTVTMFSDDEKFTSLVALLPKEYRTKKTILETITKVYNEHGYDYAKRNIEYSNKHCKTNYRAYLAKALREDWGMAFQEDKETKEKLVEKKKIAAEEKKRQMKDEEAQKTKERFLVEQANEYINNLTSEEFGLLEKQALGNLDPSLRKKAEANDSIAKGALKFEMRDIAKRKLEKVK